MKPPDLSRLHNLRMDNDAHRFDIDHPGKDSHRLTAAGADTTLEGLAKLEPEAGSAEGFAAKCLLIQLLWQRLIEAGAVRIEREISGK